MGFTSQDDLLTQLSAGKYLRRECAKVITPAQVAGSWHCLAALAGTPNPTTWPATQDMSFQSCSELGGDGLSTTLFGIQHGGDMAGSATKHIINVGASVAAAAGQPWQAKLIDICGYYYLSGANITGTSGRTLVNSCTPTFSSSSGLLATYAAGSDFNTYTKVRFTNAGGALPVGLAAGTDYWTVRVSATTCRFATSLANAQAGTVISYTDGGSGTHTMMTYNPRYTNGVGCEAFFVCKAASTAGGPNMTASAYDSTTDTAGLGTRAFQGTPNMKATPIATEVIHSGTAAAGRYGPFLPKQGGDLGIARVNSFTWSGGTAYTGTGTGALVICKPLLDLSIPVTGMWSERDLVNQLPSLPKVEDGACLAWMLFSTAATTNNSPFWATIDFGWGG
jgi:hypothetical protein